MLNPNLTKEDALWLLNDFQPLIGRTVFGKNVGMYTKAINLIRGTNAGNPGCSCEYKLHAQVAQSLFGQHKSSIEEVANAV